MDSRRDLSVAVQPSEAGTFAPPTTGASFTDRHSIMGSRKEVLLTSRSLYDVDARHPLYTSPAAFLNREDNSQNQAMNGWTDNQDVRKQIMEDSALEAEIHRENVAHRKSMGKHGGLRHPFTREHLQTGPLGEKSKSLGRSPNSCKPRLTKAQTEFIASQPQRPSQQLVKKPGGIFHRQMSSGGRGPQRPDVPSINKLDARNEKSMSAQERIVAWLEQGEKYMQEQQSTLYSPVRATLDPSPGGRQGKSTQSVPSPSAKKNIQKGSLWCCGALFDK